MHRVHSHKPADKSEKESNTTKRTARRAKMSEQFDTVKQADTTTVSDPLSPSSTSSHSSVLTLTSSPVLCTAEEEHQFQSALQQQGAPGVKPFWVQKYEEEAVKNWDRFYKRNTTNFYKDRHYISAEFTELTTALTTLLPSTSPSTPFEFFEIGCGVGNAFFPLYELYQQSNVHFIGADCSKNAIEMVKQNPLYNAERMHLFVTDITQPIPLPPTIQVDFATLIFVLSAVHPDKMEQVLANIRTCMKPGGILFFRDYALYDLAQLRFAATSKLSENWYVRQDGTRSYFFLLPELLSLLHRTGWDIIHQQYAHKSVVNRKEGKEMRRTFVQIKARAVTVDGTTRREENKATTT